MLKRKGSALDLFYIVIGFFVVCVVGILVSSVVTNFDTEFKKIGSGVVPTEAQSASTKLTSVMPGTLNAGMLFLFFGACAVALLLAALTPFNPVFFIFFILELVLLIIVSGGIANAFQAFIESAALTTEHSQYGVIIFMFRYLPFIIGLVGFALAAIMYKVRQNQQ